MTMNIHCLVTFTILLLVLQVSLVTAQRRWDSAYGYRHYDTYDVPVIEVRHPNFFDFGMFDDPFTHALRRLHLLQPVDPPPIIYVPRVHYSPDVYVEERFPYYHTYNHFNDHLTHPHTSRLLTTISVSYKAKVLPVKDYSEEDKKSKEDSLSTGSDDVPKVATKPGNESKVTNKNTTKKDANVAPKPTVKVEPDAKPEVESKPENETKPEAESKPVSDKTTETNVIADATKVPADKAVVEKKPVDETVKATEAATPDSGATDATPSTTPEKTGDDATTVADVATA